jgi:rhodanese-related sulfurtransferase
METSTVINYLMYGLIAWFLYTRLAPIKGLNHLNAENFKRRMEQDKNYVLIDVREPVEYKQGFIPGAQNIPLSQLKARYTEIPADKDVLLYCRSGMRSKQAARILNKKGFSKLAHLKGGILSWG